MRILCVPNITKERTSNLLTDSAFKLFYEVADRLQGDAFFYFILPGQFKDSVPTLPSNCMVVFEKETINSFAYRDCFLSSETLSLFSRRYGKYPIDAVITSRKGSAVEIMKLNDEHKATKLAGRDDTWIPIFLIDPNVEKLSEAKGYLDAVSYLCSIPVFLSDIEKRKALALLMEYFQPSVLKDKDFQVIPLGIRFDKIDEITSGIEKGHERIKVFYGARMNKWKKTKEIFDAYAHLHAAGRDNVDFIACTITGMMTAYGQALIDQWGKFFRLYTNYGWEDYLKFAAASHVALVASPRESLGIAFIECLYLGVIMIFPDKDWVYQIVPEDYYFIYKSKAEMLAMLKYVVDNYEEAWKKFVHVPEYVRTRFQDSTTNEHFLRVVEQKVGLHRKATKYRAEGSFASVMAKAISLRDALTWQELIAGIEKNSRSINFPQSKHFRRPVQPTDYDIYVQMIEGEGFVDTCDSEFPNFKRERA